MMKILNLNHLKRLWIVCFAIPCCATNSPNPVPVTTWPGYLRREVTGVAISGRYAYTAAYYAGLQILDVSDPANIFWVGSYNPGGASSLTGQGPTAENVAISGNLAYVVFVPKPGSSGGLHIVDVTEPSAPVVRGKVFTSSVCTDVAVAGKYAYVAAQGDGLLIADVSDPAKPVARGQYNSPGSAYSVAVAGDYAYVADGPSGLQIVNIADPAKPVRVGGYDTTGEAVDVAILGQRAYVADGAGGLRIIDVSNPAAPTPLSRYNTTAWGLAISGGYVYLGDDGAGFRIVDVTDASVPTPVANYGTLRSTRNIDYARNFAVAGTNVYINRQGFGLEVIDITDLSNPVRLGGFATGGASAVAASAQHVLIGDGPAGIHVVDMADAARPTRVGGLTNVAERIFASDRYGLANSYDGVQSVVLVLNLSEPSKPSIATELPEVEAQAVSGIYGYLTDETSLQIWNMEDPAAPALIGTHPTESNWSGPVAVAGSYAYVFGSGKVEIVDVNSPAMPVHVGNYPVAALYGPPAMAAAGHYLFVVESNSQGRALLVIDVSNPAAPVRKGRLVSTSNIHEIVARGDHLYLANDSAGLAVIDVSDPSIPRRVATRATPPSADGVAVSGEYAFVANGFAGVSILRLPTEAVERPALGITASGGGIVLSWPASAGNFALESAAALSGATPWMAVPQSGTLSGDRLLLTNGISAGAAFYRLRRP